MLRTSRIIKVSILAIIISAGLFYFSTSAYALTVSPIRTEISGFPGDVLKVQVKISNEEVEDKIIYTSYENFESQDESGTPKYFPAIDGLGTWIDPVEVRNLKPKEAQNILLTINIPEKAEPGGYFSVAFFGSNPPGTDELDETGVGLGARVGSLILLRVIGDITEDAGILEFGTENNQKFHTSLPIVFTYRLQNSGEDRIVPEGVVRIKNSVRLVSKFLIANPAEGGVLPRSIRRFFTVWVEAGGNVDQLPYVQAREPAPTEFWDAAKYELSNFAMGWYTAELDIKYGIEDVQQGFETFHFFVFPWHVLILVLPMFIIAAVIFGLFIRRYNRWIIRTAGGKPTKRKK